MEITIDKEFKKLIPPIDYEEFLILEESIKKEGCRDPLITWNKILLDGHNRHKICQAHEIPFKTKELSFESREEAEQWIINNQLGRRNICVYDRILLTQKKVEYLKEEAEKRQKAGEPLDNNVKRLNIRKETARIANVSEGTIAKFNQIKEKITKQQEKDLRDKKITLNKVFQEHTQKEKEEKRKQLRKEKLSRNF